MEMQLIDLLSTCANNTLLFCHITMQELLLCLLRIFIVNLTVLALTFRFQGNQGYFESGVELNQMLRFFGLTAFYRYGPNQLSRFEDNIAIKLSFQINLGF